MKYSDVITMSRAGIRNATSHSVSLNGAYSLTRFKIEIDRLVAEYEKQISAFAMEAGIEDVSAFDNRRIELGEKNKSSSINKAEKKELEELNKKFEKAWGLRSKLNDEEVSLSCKPMSYEDWHNLMEENRNLTVQNIELFVVTEAMLENILWKAPEE